MKFCSLLTANTKFGQDRLSIKYLQASRRKLTKLYYSKFLVVKKSSKLRDQNLLNFSARRGAKERGYRHPISELFIDFPASQQFRFLNLCSSHSHNLGKMPCATDMSSYEPVIICAILVSTHIEECFLYFFDLFLKAPWRRYGRIVSSPVHCFAPG